VTHTLRRCCFVGVVGYHADTSTVGVRRKPQFLIFFTK